MIRDWKSKIALVAVGAGLATLVAVGILLAIPASNDPGLPITISQATAVPTPTTTLTCYNGLIVEWQEGDRDGSAWRQCVASTPVPDPGPIVPCGKDSAIYGHSEPCALPTCPPGYAQGMFCDGDKEEWNTIPEPPPLPDIPGCDPYPIGYSDDGWPIFPPCLDDWGSGGDGPTALCVDGTYSDSMSRSGTCSWHGGVEVWLR